MNNKLFSVKEYKLELERVQQLLATAEETIAILKQEKSQSTPATPPAAILPVESEPTIYKTNGFTFTQVM